MVQIEATSGLVAVLWTVLPMFGLLDDRMEAFWRTAAFVWAWTGALILFSIISFLGFIAAVLDIIWVALTGNGLFTDDGTVYHVVAESWMWWSDLHVYAYTGKGGGFEGFPSV